MEEKYADALITDFTDTRFQAAFKQYFTELGLHVRDWDGLWREMNGEGDNAAFLRIGPDRETVGFIQFKPIRFTSWFFEETCGFIREFWVSPAARRRGHGTGLLALAEARFLEKGMHTAILTTDTAAVFYVRHGYVRAHGCRAKNGDNVYVKKLG